MEVGLFLVALAGAGLLAGFIGGLFGVGGGVVIVPALYALFTAIGVYDDVRMHVAVGTSLSTIIATSWRSLSAHRKAGAVDDDILRAWAPWIALGAIAGSALAGLADTRVLLAIFGGGLFLIALQVGLADPAWRIAERMPRGGARASLASGLGLLSAMMGIGGGAFGVTIMTLCGRPIHRAVATASGFGAAIALPAALGLIVAGWGRAGLPPYSLGYVNAPGFALLAALTALTAPLGAGLAHRLPQLALKRAFSVVLGALALNMLRQSLS
jgi:uncharacterized membrane protein YfcA